jgi:hypothetical protein
MAIEFKSYEGIVAALDAHKKITGTGLFEGFENSQAEKVRMVNKGRKSPWMVDQATGDIYYIFEDDRTGLRLFNKLTLGACLDDSPFQRVIIQEGWIEIGDPKYKRDNVSRKTMGKMNWIVATCMQPTTCTGCVRLEQGACNHWANMSCHDEHEPIRCERYTQDPDVLVREKAEQEALKAKMAQADIDNPPPF